MLHFILQSLGRPTEEGKCGRGTEKLPVVIGLSPSPTGYPKYVKTQVVPNMSTDALKAGATSHSDGYRSYQSLAAQRFSSF
ncbi:hypothetical protein St703_27300 [Sporolactobacillus terrae]|uniref:Uncharacterized protein n=1 Tax=Sporolactobacillus terrae TaxID=269673 RepID=A0A5K7WZG6_9BACL|nr:hypothetical protein St703_27300 [Sporolactobacillus terrae]